MLLLTMRVMHFFSSVFQNSRTNLCVCEDEIFMRHTYAQLVIQLRCHVSKYTKCLPYHMVLRLKKGLLVVQSWKKPYWNFSITKDSMN